MHWLMEIPRFIFELLFGCRHERQTRPFTLEQQTYKVCLNCGQHVFYSADEMRPMTAGELRRMRTAQSRSGKVIPLTAAVRNLVIPHSPSSSKSRSAA